jgi:hypothetical protein
MRYRDIQYSVVQGIGQHIWKWTVWFDANHSASGQSPVKSAAIISAERAIDRELGSKKLRLVSPESSQER